MSDESDESDVMTRMKRLEEYRELREELEEMMPQIHEDIRALVGGEKRKKKAEIARASGLSRPWIDRIIDNER